MPFKTGLLFTYDCGDFARGMDMALDLADRKGFEERRRAARQRGKLRGLGMANAIEVAGGPYTSVNPDTAQLQVNPDGSLSLFAGTTSMGQGNETAFTQIVSEGTGVPADRIQVFWGDSDLLGAGRGNGGSGALTVGGSAVLRATERIVDRGRRIAAQMLEAAPADVSLRDGRFTVAGTDRGVTFAQVAKTAYQPPVTARGHGAGLQRDRRVHAPGRSPSPTAARSARSRSTPRPARWRSCGYSVVDDVGKMVNPLAGQGTDPRRGRAGARPGTLRGPDLRPRDGPAPRRLVHGLRDAARRRRAALRRGTRNEVPTKVNPLGAKGVGEAGTVGALPALLNAVNDALAPLGVRHLDMPVTPERVWRAIQDAGATAGARGGGPRGAAQ